jgi:hypothetical protein
MGTNVERTSSKRSLFSSSHPEKSLFYVQKKHQLTLTDKGQLTLHDLNKGQLTLPNDRQQKNTVLSHANIEITVTKRPPSSLIKELCSRIDYRAFFPVSFADIVTSRGGGDNAMGVQNWLDTIAHSSELNCVLWAFNYGAQEI